MSPDISIIVPVYNADKKLRRCIESIRSQTMSSLEIIIVNDGSTDTSGKICDEFAIADDRICVIHQENRGALMARAAGCEMASSKYISFVDADDWIENDMFEQLLYKMQGGDLLASGFYRNSFDGSFNGCRLNVLKAGRYNLTDFNNLEGFFFPAKYVYGEDLGAIINSMCGKIFRREIIMKFIDSLNVRIRESEDWMFNVLYILHCENIAVVDECYYHYCANDNSVTYSSNLDFLAEQNLLYKIIMEKLLKHPAKDIITKQIQKKIMLDIISETGKKLDFDDEVLVPKWSFSDNECLVGKNVVLFGAGNIGRCYIIDWLKKKINITAWLDNTPRDIEMFGRKPEKPEVINNLNFDYVVCAVREDMAFKAIKKQLMDMGVDEKKILWSRPVYTWLEYFL